MSTRRTWIAAALVLAALSLAVGPAAAQDGAQAAMPLPFGLPEIKLRTILVGIHLAGLCLGLGGVLVLDALLAKAVLRGVFYAHNRALVRVLSETTGVGLIILWASGLAFLALYWRDHPELLDNPKLYAKIVIVAALTLNGWLVERFCSPLIEGDLDGPVLVTFSAPMRLLGVFSGVFSAVSWYTAALLGVMRELNGVTPARTILIGWGLALLAGFCVALVAGMAIERRRPEPGARDDRLRTVSLSDIQLRLRPGSRR